MERCLQSGEDVPEMEGWSVKEDDESNKLTNEKMTMGDTGLPRQQTLIERKMGSIFNNTKKDQSDELKQKLKEVEDSPQNLDILPIFLLI